jgi:hypothetical protein
VPVSKALSYTKLPTSMVFLLLLVFARLSVSLVGTLLVVATLR